MTPTIRIPKWSEFQHYKNRNPPWIKLHRQLLNKRGWRGLDPFAAKLLVEVWLVASETNDGNIELSTADLTWHLRYHESEVQRVARGLVDLASLSLIELCDHDASNVLAECLQVASAEERERRVEESSVSKETGELHSPKIETVETSKAETPDEAWKRLQPLLPPAIRKHAWLGDDPPTEPRNWNMGREISIAKQLLKQFTPEELIGGIETYREAHAVPGDKPWSLSWVYGAGDRWRIVTAVQQWRAKQVDQCEFPTFTPMLHVA